LEARFPGKGHEMAAEFRQSASAAAQAGWPPPDRIPTPKSKPSSAPRRTIGMDASHSVERKKSLVSSTRLDVVLHREADHIALFAGNQFQSTAAPPAPDARKSLFAEPFVSDAAHTLDDYSPRTDVGSGQRRSVVGINLSKISDHSTTSMVDVAPPQRPNVYPVLVPTRGADSARLDSCGRPRPAAAADPRRRRKTEREAMASTGAAVLAGSGSQSARGPGPRAAAARLQAFNGVEVNKITSGSLELTSDGMYNHMDEFEASLRTIPTKGNFWCGSGRWAGNTESAGPVAADSDDEHPVA